MVERDHYFQWSAEWAALCVGLKIFLWGSMGLLDLVV
jgi:hypothetical protein